MDAPILWQQVAKLLLQEGGGEHIGKPGLWIYIIKAGPACHDGSAVGAGEQPGYCRSVLS